MHWYADDASLAVRYITNPLSTFATSGAQVLPGDAQAGRDVRASLSLTVHFVMSCEVAARMVNPAVFVANAYAVSPSTITPGSAKSWSITKSGPVDDGEKDGAEPAPAHPVSPITMPRRPATTSVTRNPARTRVTVSALHARARDALDDVPLSER